MNVSVKKKTGPKAGILWIGMFTCFPVHGMARVNFSSAGQKKDGYGISGIHPGHCALYERESAYGQRFITLTYMYYNLKK